MMRPSVSVTLEPGLEQGVPWGRDLYTFVTSAAGHMMRTLQKPRKNRPSKRQVNHRRFLHNMIQRKFADVEAANHRLESALYLKDEEKTLTSLQSREETAASPLHRPQKCSVDVVEGGISKSRSEASIDSQQTDFYHMADDFHTENYTDERLLESIDDLPDDTQTALQNSPDLSPLSLDSCDFSIQMFTDVSTSQKSIVDIAESPWADIMDLFSVGNKDVGGSLDVGALQSICACQEDDDDDDAGQEVSAENQSDSFTQRTCSDNTSETEGPHYQSCEYTHSCQELTQFNNFRSSQCSDVTQNQLSVPIGCHYNASAYQRPEQLIHCMQVNCENNRHLTPFEGVAQSFCAPPSNPDHRPIPTPPHENDWLFPDILKERRTSPDC